MELGEARIYILNAIFSKELLQFEDYSKYLIKL